MIECQKIPFNRNLATYRFENIQQRKINQRPIKQGVLALIYINRVQEQPLLPWLTKLHFKTGIVNMYSSTYHRHQNCCHSNLDGWVGLDATSKYSRIKFHSVTHTLENGSFSYNFSTTCVAKMSLTLDEPSYNILCPNLHTTSNTCT